MTLVDIVYGNWQTVTNDYEIMQYMVGSVISWMTPPGQFSMLQCGHRVHLASFPGLHAQLLLLAIRKAGEGLDGLIM